MSNRTTIQTKIKDPLILKDFFARKNYPLSEGKTVRSWFSTEEVDIVFRDTNKRSHQLDIGFIPGKDGYTMIRDEHYAREDGLETTTIETEYMRESFKKYLVPQGFMIAEFHPKKTKSGGIIGADIKAIRDTENGAQVVTGRMVDGTVQIETCGFQGNQCYETTKELRYALGSQVATSTTEEFYQTNDNRITLTHDGEGGGRNCNL